jgi:hypothetical protein
MCVVDWPLRNPLLGPYDGKRVAPSPDYTTNMIETCCTTTELPHRDVARPMRPYD